MEKKTTTLSVYLKPELLQRLKDLADKENRSLSNLVETLLSQAVRNR